MGRAKLNMELITKEKSRNVTFKKRKEGLVRKMHEFATLCDVSACMIIYGPKQESSGFGEPEIWPANPDEVRRIIGIYKSKNKDSGNKTFGLSDFFHDRKRKIEDELLKLRKKNMEAKYPPKPDFLDYWPEPQLREFASALTNKSDYVRSRIEFLRRNREGLMEMNMNMNLNMNMNMPMPMNYHYPMFDHHHHQEMMNPNNSMMMLLMNNDHHRGQGSSGNELYKHQFFQESNGLVEMGQSPKPLARYYGPSLNNIPVPFPVGPPMSSLMAPQFQFPAKLESNGGDGIEDLVSLNQYDLNHNRGRYYDQ